MPQSLDLYREMRDQDRLIAALREEFRLHKQACDRRHIETTRKIRDMERRSAPGIPSAPATGGADGFLSQISVIRLMIISALLWMTLPSQDAANLLEAVAKLIMSLK